MLLEDFKLIQLFKKAIGPVYQTFKSTYIIRPRFSVVKKFILKSSQKYGVHFRHRVSHQDISNYI